MYNYKNDFPLLANSTVAYLDNAATARARSASSMRRIISTEPATPIRCAVFTR